MKPFMIKGRNFGIGMPKICIPITGENAGEILAQADRISHEPHDVVEWRGDFFSSVSDFSAVQLILEALRKALPHSLILFTFRTKNEGGEKEISVEEYLSLNKKILDSGLVDLLDLEFFTGREPDADNSIAGKPEESKSNPETLLRSSPLIPLLATAKEKGVKIILSNHDFEKTPREEEILSRLRAMDNLGGDIAKIAVMPRSKADVLTLLSATVQASDSLSCPVITMSMGKLGAITRILGEFSGSCMTFGTAGRASAPGQLEAKKLEELLTLLQ